MNLRDKLKAVDAGKKKTNAVNTPVSYTCYAQERHHDLAEFPGAFALQAETLRLLQGEDVPEDFDPRCILYLDTETTGLGGGAGTVAFEIGVGWLEEGGFTVRQYVMRDYPEERHMLEELERLCGRFDMLCTFNGKTFDLPLLRTRFLMNRMKPDCLDKPHIDLMHIARRVWKLRLKRCNLARLEEMVLGIPRENDLPGSEAPERFFSFLKTGQFELLREVLEHNEQDIASLCVLLNYMAQLYEHPEKNTADEDTFSMGVSLEKSKHPEEAKRCYRLVKNRRLHAEGQLRTAAIARRGGSILEARDTWQAMITHHEGGVKPYIELAKYYEHHARDLDMAMEMTVKAMSLLGETVLWENKAVQETKDALQYRYARLKRKRGKE